MTAERELRTYFAVIFPKERYPGDGCAIHFLAAEIKLLRAVIAGYETNMKIKRVLPSAQEREHIRKFWKEVLLEEPFHG